MARRKQRQPDLATAIDNLVDIQTLDERGRIQLLIDTQSRLNNGDAMAYFGRWLDAVVEVLDIDLPDEDPTANPFA